MAFYFILKGNWKEHKANLIAQGACLAVPSGLLCSHVYSNIAPFWCYVFNGVHHFGALFCRWVHHFGAMKYTYFGCLRCLSITIIPKNGYKMYRKEVKKMNNIRKNFNLTEDVLDEFKNIKRELNLKTDSAVLTYLIRSYRERNNLSKNIVG